jgi:hypothetical protein
MITFDLPDDEEELDNHLTCRCCKRQFPMDEEHFTLCKSIEQLSYYNDDEGHVFKTNDSRYLTTICKRCTNSYLRESDLKELSDLLILVLSIRMESKNKNYPITIFSPIGIN